MESAQLLIKARLEAASLPSFTGQYFIPDVRLQEIMHTGSVGRELERTSYSLQELLPDNESNVIRKRDQGGTSPGHARGAFGRVYAILVLIDRSKCITSFIRDGIDDSMLPLSFTEDEPSTIASRSCFDGWDSLQIKAFAERQWSVLPPVLERPTETFRFPRLDARYILPFTNYSPRSSSPIRGGFSEVFKVRFHAGQTSAHANNDGFKDAFALKRIYSSARGSHDLHKEIEALGKFSGQETGHPHIIKLLAAFSHDDNHYLVFPWADGSLRTLWRENPTPSADRQAVLWLADQLVGLTGALGAIHQYSSRDGPLLSGRHGDIKPENILVFNETSGAAKLSIADFGVARFHTSEARLNHDLPTALTPTYRPPEFDLRSSASREYDIWSLGCVFLEMITWLLHGYDGVKSFAASRMASIKDPNSESMKKDSFFTLGQSSDLHVKTASIKPSVDRCINQLHQAPQCSVLFHDLLDLIKNEMLQVDEKCRATSFRVLDRLKEMRQKCRREADYTAPKPCPLKPPWILRHPNRIQTEKSSEIRHLSQYHTDFTTCNPLFPVDMTHNSSHCQPGQPGGTSKQQIQPLFCPAETCLHTQYIPEEHGLTIIPAPSDSASIDAVPPQYFVAPVQDVASEKGKRKLGVAVSDTDEERLRKRTDIKCHQEQTGFTVSTSAAENQQDFIQQNSDQLIDTPISQEAHQVSETNFACPFYKRHPEKFEQQPQARELCATRGWMIHRLKEHIIRRHGHSLHQCSRCFMAFEKEEDLKKHQRAIKPCPIAQQPECEGIDESQKSKIRKKNLGKTKEDTWCEMYRIIFRLDRNDKIPTPYWEKKESVPLSKFQGFIDSLFKAGNSETKVEVEICMRYLRDFQNSRRSSQITKNLSLSTLDYKSSQMNTNSDAHDQETKDTDIFSDMFGESPAGPSKGDFQIDATSIFDLTGDFFQGGSSVWDKDAY